MKTKRKYWWRLITLSITAVLLMLAAGTSQAFTTGGTIRNLTGKATNNGTTLSTPPATTTTTLTTSVNPSTVGRQVIFTAVVSPSDATGSVQFTVDDVPVGAPVTLPTPSPLASRQGNTYGMAVDATSVYWLNASDRTLKKVGINGGTATTLATDLSALPSLGLGGNSVAVDSASVYWTDFGSGTVNKVSITGETSQTLAFGVAPGGIAIDALNVYWADPGDGTIKKTGIYGGEVTNLVSGLLSAMSISVDATSVYFTESDGGTVKKVGINGGEVTTLASGLNNPNNIAVDAVSVYWTESGAVKRVGINGGTVTTLASGLSLYTYIGSIAVDDSNAYWVSEDGVLSVGINGGAVTTLASGPHGPFLALDATNVYCNFQDADNGTIQKAPKSLLAGTARIGISNLPVGAHTIAAEYSGDTTNAPSVDRLTQTVNSATYKLDVAITGGGTITNVNSSGPTYSCNSPNCNGSFDVGSQFTLRATPSASYLFGGWTGVGAAGHCGGTGDCLFTLNADTTITALFNLTPPVRVAGNPDTYYQTLGEAYASAVSENTLIMETQATTFTGGLNLNNSVNLFLMGGYDSNFSTSPTGMSILQGVLTVGRGSLLIDRFVVE